MNDTIARFPQRRQLQQAAARRPRLVALPARADAPQPLDQAFIDAPSLTEMEADGNGADVGAQARALLAELADGHHRQRFDAMLAEMQGTVLQTVAGAFGLGKLVSAYDREGGAVDTVHNVRHGVFATDEERRRFDGREAYDTTAAHSHKAYKDANAAMKARRDAGTLVDSYTGQAIGAHHKNDAQLGASLDHVVAAKNVHDDAGRVLAGLDTANLANVGDNLTATTRTVNSKKRTLRAAELADRLQRDAGARQARLAELDAGKASWTDKERKEHAKLKAQDAVDAERLLDKEARARAAIDSEVNRTYYTSGKFVRAAATVGVTEGARMGVQQAVGVVVVEFLAGALAEVKDLYRRGRSEASFMAEIGVRLRRVGERVAGKWKSALAGMRDGFIAGLLSSIATTLINAFVTTAQRAGRMIREGLMSLLRAVKLLLVRPDGMTRQESMHEASKVLVGTAILVGGLALEEVVSKQLALVPGLGVVAEAGTAAVVGAVTAIATGFAVYLLDKADLFNVNEAKRTIAIGRALDERLAASFEALESGAVSLGA